MLESEIRVCTDRPYALSYGGGKRQRSSICGIVMIDSLQWSEGERRFAKSVVSDVNTPWQ